MLFFQNQDFFGAQLKAGHCGLVMSYCFQHRDLASNRQGYILIKRYCIRLRCKSCDPTEENISEAEEQKKPLQQGFEPELKFSS